MRILLIGYRATGKTTAARLAAEKLGWPFFDVDTRIVEKAGKTVKDIFAEDGESRFRDIEDEVLREHLAHDPVVVSTGGGTLLRPANRVLAKQCDVVAWLEASPEAIWERMERDPGTSSLRPNLTTKGGLEEVRELLAVRSPVYGECATARIATEGKTPHQVAAEIVSLVQR